MKILESEEGPLIAKWLEKLMQAGYSKDYSGGNLSQKHKPLFLAQNVNTYQGPEEAEANERPPQMHVHRPDSLVLNNASRAEDRRPGVPVASSRTELLVQPTVDTFP